MNSHAELGLMHRLSMSYFSKRVWQDEGFDATAPRITTSNYFVDRSLSTASTPA